MANDEKFYKEESKKNYYTSGNITIEHLNTGSLQRIADAMEKMAVNHIQLQRDYDYVKRSLESERSENAYLRKSNAAYKGVIKKMKKSSLKNPS